MSEKHTPEFWRVGRLLNTKITSRYTPELRAKREAEESKMVFANFTPMDEGKSRVLVCNATTPENALRIAVCVNACVGMENPADEIKKLRDEIENLKDRVKRTSL